MSLHSGRERTRRRPHFIRHSEERGKRDGGRISSGIRKRGENETEAAFHQAFGRKTRRRPHFIRHSEENETEAAFHQAFGRKRDGGKLTSLLYRWRAGKLPGLTRWMDLSLPQIHLYSRDEAGLHLLPPQSSRAFSDDIQSCSRAFRLLTWRICCGRLTSPISVNPARKSLFSSVSHGRD